MRVKEGVLKELDDFIPDKKLFEKMVSSYGYKSVRQFAKAADISPANLSDRLSGRYAVSVPMMYKIAETLGCSFDNVMMVFYPKLLCSCKSNARGTYRNKITGEVLSYKKLVDYCKENYDYGDVTNSLTYNDRWYEECGFEKITGWCEDEEKSE